MTTERFKYVTYIAASPETVFRALMDGQLTRQYWKHTNESDWKPGSKWKHVAGDAQGAGVLVVGTVIEVIPNRRLVITWAAPGDLDNPKQRSKVTFDVESIGAMVRLTVSHEDLVAGSDMANKVANGWPRVLSSLKSLLETGRPLDTWAS
jgi:uncharacterized protein YndB with AHSA1/START domain